MSLMTRLDFYGTDGESFHKPRRGVCGICKQLVIEHPTWRHRITALLDLTVGRVLGVI